MTILNDSLRTYSEQHELLQQSGKELRRFLEEAAMPDRATEVSGHHLRLELDSVKIAVNYTN